MASKKGFLITVRTARQGAAMEKGKFSAEYIAETTSLTLSPRDYQELALTEGCHVRIRSDSGQALVTCRSAEGPDGVFFLPLGPTANTLIGEQTYGTGVPSYKGFPVELETAEL
ncbi:MAG: formylmethanofuran dehydrogenase [Synergistaceae bacterium]|jgi:formylmethanofuran dehydrogenase subunit D|nr:formylmethanofuran dehydrogenase [Synergistaceae bacterium]